MNFSKLRAAFCENDSENDSRKEKIPWERRQIKCACGSSEYLSPRTESAFFSGTDGLNLVVGVLASIQSMTKLKIVRIIKSKFKFSITYVHLRLRVNVK